MVDHEIALKETMQRSRYMEHVLSIYDSFARSREGIVQRANHKIAARSDLLKFGRTRLTKASVAPSKNTAPALAVVKSRKIVDSFGTYP